MQDRDRADVPGRAPKASAAITNTGGTEGDRLVPVIDQFAKEHLLDELRWTREAMLGKLDGLSEYDARRPLTITGTNLLGLVKHLTLTEAWYLGEIFSRPFPELLPRWNAAYWESYRARIEQAAKAAAPTLM
jgi:hypothetical protein